MEEEYQYMLNPILSKSLSRFYDVDLPLVTDDVDKTIESFLGQMSTTQKKIECFKDLDEDENWGVFKVKAISNFNYKKSLLGVDYEQMIAEPSSQILNLFTSEQMDVEKEEEAVISVLQLDESQKRAVHIAQNENVVIQGPPGTGKSQTIVGLIGNYLSKGKKVLFVSQKRSALDVVKNRLEDIGLGPLTAYFNTEKDEKKVFFSALKKSWELLHESEDPVTNPKRNNKGVLNYYLSEYSAQNDRLSDSVYGLVRRLADAKNDPRENAVIGEVPSLSEWRKSRSNLLSIEEKIRSQLSVNSIRESFIPQLNKAIFSEIDPLTKLNGRIDQLLLTLKEINRIGDDFEIRGNIDRFTQIAIAASILNLVNRSQLDVLNIDSKQYKSFGNWAKKYQLMRSKVSRQEQANSKWGNKPSKSEITELIDLIKHRHAPKGILGILQRKNERLEAAFKNFDKHITDTAKLQLLEELRVEWNLKAELSEISLKLKHNFNIEDPENEVDQILRLRNKLNEISKNSYLEILEHNDSVGLIHDLSALHPQIQSFNHLCKFIFESSLKQDLDDVESKLLSLKDDISHMRLILPEIQLFFKLPQIVKRFVSDNAGTIEELELLVVYYNLIEQTRSRNVFDLIDGKSLVDDLEANLRAEQLQCKSNVIVLVNHFKSALREVEKLLATPASKLKDEAKLRKKGLRAQHKLLIHEISKQKQHVPIKKFMDECWELLSIVNPVWIMNPLAVSERLQCQKEIFDVVIFDESSQIPLEDSLPSIYRAKHVVVVGDDKQMPPTSFFSSSQDSITLLDKADVVYKREMLKWHYRSEHPALIGFSNSYFYENELFTLPPTFPGFPIEHKFVEGVFDERVNVVEADAIAKYLTKISPADHSKYGVIAFSKDQEEEIRKHLRKNKNETEELLIRNLENVQGVERDIVLISVGYAKDKTGVFRLNFGPINQQSGANRLNVLFTRAKQKIVLFSSVKADEFGLSDNFGVSCLRDYIQYVEDQSGVTTSKSLENSFFNAEGVVYYGPLNGSSVKCYVQHASSKVLLIDPCLSSDESLDLLTIYTVLKHRFKEVKILLTQDKWVNEERFNLEFKNFFQKK
jgi:superfamily I DNA and/or RNA helicase/KaiC/GvpD/RAD55 family RecA-like ATPase